MGSYPTARIVLFASLLLLVGGLEHSSAAGELYLIISPRSATLTADGFIDFDAYIYNAGKKRVEVPSPYGGYDVAWTLRDICKVRSDRKGTHSIIGTHTVDPQMINPGGAIRCEHLGDRFLTEPGDILEFYITIERKSESRTAQTIRSNSILMYRPKEESPTGQGAKIDNPAPASSPKAAITAEGTVRLFLLTSKPYIAEGKPVSLDIYLYNEGKKATTLPPLKFVSADWSLTDPAARRLPRSGVLATISDHGTPEVEVPPGAVLYENIQVDIKAKPGDLLKVNARLGERRILESNSILLYCSRKK